MRIVSLTDHVAVSQQILPEDIPEIAAAGFKVLINNRPDGEEVGQPSDADIAAAADMAGIEYHHFPITAMNFPGAGIETMRALFNNPDRPVLAFCRSGTRCANLWVATRDDGQRMEAARSAHSLGYDLAMVASTHELK
ncbi:MAG: TIGR01244 family sulfur transferase [Halioglobus sp.]